ncbi:ATP-binding protein [Actinoplanes sp. KI2]|uniref:sensor histidine kinase n=1 Tax=Actinoplanes sp. KI2 TaxID=2983315 RepID=UPI0021D5C5E6|nr:ATP-binding protein [Actinoplanes sp. KI2]MCU7726043.1 ATP-binding protein [Actinoplanes sp. KI2]
MGVRTRYTILYGAMILVTGLGLIAIIGAFGSRSTTRAGGDYPAPAAEQIERLQRRLAQSDEAHSQQLVFGLVVGMVVALLLSLVLGRLLAGRVLKPLRVITAATRRISADNLHQRLAVQGPADEVKDLADTIDGLLGRLEESFAAQRRFVADASHELRTPLATMRASLDVAMAKPSPVPAETAVLADRIRAELDRVDRLLEGFLVLARAQHGALDDRSAVSLGALAREALPASSTNLEVYADLDADVVTEGNPVLLARLVGNVIDNAIRHNVSGGWVRVSVSGVSGVARLVVQSSGPVLDPSQVARLGRPFQRLGAERTGDGGTGLGLSIVAAVASAHGGSVSLTALPAGGLTVTVDLPLAVAVPA